MSKNESVKIIEYELSILIRYGIDSSSKLGDLDRSAYLLLRTLHDQGAVGVKTLAEKFQLNVSTVSRQTAVLQSKGYVKRIPDPMDGRASSFQITELGLQKLTEANRARIDKYTELLQDWSTEERIQFGELLGKLNRSLID
jgi:DNA-binding MarR family transcriptional regulator